MKRALPVVLCLLMASTGKAADLFDRHTTFWLRQAVQRNQALPELSSSEARKLKTFGRGIDSPCLVVRTNHGHWSKLLVSWAFHRGPQGPVPVLVIDRFVTFDAGQRDVSLCAGEDVMLFPGFVFDLEVGQVIPAQLSGDLTFTEDRLLKPLGQAALVALDGPIVPGGGPDGNPDPNDHDGVLPRDFSGSWRVQADGRWSGVWDVTVDDEGTALGTYTSDGSKSVYPLRGRLGGAANHMVFEVELTGTTQSYEAYLWTKDKSAMAGTTTLAGHKFGFFATRIVVEDPAAPRSSD